MSRIEIIPPEGYEIDEENKDPYRITFRRITSERPIKINYLAHSYDTYNMDTVVRMGEDPNLTDIARFGISFKVHAPKGYLNYKPIREFLEDVIAPQIEKYYNDMLEREIGGEKELE